MIVLIVIVVYNKRISDLTIFKEKFNHNIDIYIYDNSKHAQVVPFFKNVNIYYEHDPNNNGVSRAYNHAFKKAKELNKKLILLLDQDSNFKIRYLEQYLKLYKKYKDEYIYAPIVCNKNKTKIYSPSFMKYFIGKVQKFNNFNYKEIYNIKNKSIINSGLMIPLKLYEKIGGYNEIFKLDFSDIYFIEKYKQINIFIVLVNIYLKHNISGDEGYDFFKEYNRFKYYCNACYNIERNLNVSAFLPSLKRLLRLIYKYKKLNFIFIYYKYYIKGNNI